MPTTREPDPDQVDVIGRAKDTISAIPSLDLNWNLRRRLLKTIFLHSAHSSSDGGRFLVNQSSLPFDLK